MIKISTYTDQTNIITGAVAIAIKIPGTFSSMDPQTPGFEGRKLIKLSMWLETRAALDSITGLAISDLDNVLPAPYTGTTIANLIDQTVSGANQALTLPIGNTPFNIDFPIDPTIPTYSNSIIPSGLYLVVTFTKHIAGVDRASVNVAWDDFT